MGAIADLRDTLVADLAAIGVPVHPAWPVSFVAPCGFIIPPLGTPYVAAGPSFGGYTLTLDLVLVVAHGPAEESLDALETLIEAALANTEDWDLIGVEAPAPTTVTDGGAEYLCTAIHLSHAMRL